MKKLWTTSFLVVFVTVISFAQTINKSKSVVNFKIGKMKINTVKGTFGGMEGTAKFDPHNISASVFNVCIDTETIDTGNSRRDKDLRSDNYFDVENYPKICFEATSVAISDNGYVATGNLSMHGVTKTVEIPFTYSQNTFNGNLALNRQDYNIGKKGTFMVGNEVEINIIAVAN